MRIETGKVGITRTDLKALCSEYGVTEESILAQYEELAVQGRRQTWSQYSDVLNPEFVSYLGGEAIASKIQQYEPLVIPGILQYGPYALALIQALASPEHGEAHILRQVNARMARQNILKRENPPVMEFVIDEAAVRRWVAPQPRDPSVLRGQLKHLLLMASLPNVLIQLLPFAFGAHYGLRGSFVTLEFDDDDLEDMVYLEGRRRQYRSEDASFYKKVFSRLQLASSPPEDLPKLIERIMPRMPP